MERIVFKLKDYYEICDEYEESLEKYHDLGWTKPQNGNIYGVYRYRIVIPALHISLRDGEWYSVGENYVEEDDNVNWDESYQCSMYLAYPETERDIDKYIWAVGPWISDALQQACLDCNFPAKSAEELECFLDFDEIE